MSLWFQASNNHATLAGSLSMTLRLSPPEGHTHQYSLNVPYYAAFEQVRSVGTTKHVTLRSIRASRISNNASADG